MSSMCSMVSWECAWYPAGTLQCLSDVESYEKCPVCALWCRGNVRGIQPTHYNVCLMSSLDNSFSMKSVVVAFPPKSGV